MHVHIHKEWGVIFWICIHCQDDINFHWNTELFSSCQEQSEISTIDIRDNEYSATIWEKSTTWRKANNIYKHAPSNQGTLKMSTTSNFWKIQKDNSSIKNEAAKRKKLLKQSISGLTRKWNAAENQF